MPARNLTYRPAAQTTAAARPSLDGGWRVVFPSAAGTHNPRSRETTRVTQFANLHIGSFANYSLFTIHYSLGLSVDPMSRKYPHQSNYVYCSNNPVKIIDPNGEDEYFNENGLYLGSDNSESNNVRMITQSDWDRYKTSWEDDIDASPTSESIDASLGQSMGALIPESDRSVFSDDAILGVYQHYGLQSGDFNLGEINDISDCPQAIDKDPSTYSMAYYREDGNVYIPVSANRNKEILNNFYNIINTFDHEYKHKIDPAKDTFVREINADNYQMTTSSWGNTTPEFKDIRRDDRKNNEYEYCKTLQNR